MRPPACRTAIRDMATSNARASIRAWALALKAAQRRVFRRMPRLWRPVAMPAPDAPGADCKACAQSHSSTAAPASVKTQQRSQTGQSALSDSLYRQELFGIFEPSQRIPEGQDPARNHRSHPGQGGEFEFGCPINVQWRVGSDQGWTRVGRGSRCALPTRGQGGRSEGMHDGIFANPVRRPVREDLSSPPNEKEKDQDRRLSPHERFSSMEGA